MHTDKIYSFLDLAFLTEHVSKIYKPQTAPFLVTSCQQMEGHFPVLRNNVLHFEPDRCIAHPHDRCL